MDNKKTVHIQLRPELKLSRLEKKFPSINFTSTSRALMSLSKREGLDSNFNFQSAEMARKIQLRPSIYPPFNSARSVQQSLPKQKNIEEFKVNVTKTLSILKSYDTEKKNNQQKNKISKLHTPRRKQLPSPVRENIKDQASLYDGQVKFCDRKFGHIDGYAISCHAGILSLTNTIRVCAATNLLKNATKNRQVSYFGLFEGKNGTQKAQFMRQNFHNILVNDQLFFYNMQKAVSRSFEKVQQQFSENPQFQGDYSIASCVLCIIIGASMHLVKFGSPNATVSMKLGSYVKTLVTDLKEDWSKNRKSMGFLTSYTAKSTQNWNMHIRTFELSQDYDFIVLGSQGIFNSINLKNQLGRTLWRYLLDEDFQNNSKLTEASRLAKACNKICEQAVKKDSFGRSMAVLVLQFRNLSKCFTIEQDLKLPFTLESTQQPIKEEQICEQSKEKQKEKEKNFSYKGILNSQYLNSLSNLS